MNFFRSLLGTCCGTYVFRELRKNSWGRALRHLLLLCVFCSIAIGISNYLLIKYKWRAAYNNFDETFGSYIKISEEGIFPEKDPDVSRRLEFPYNTLLIYVSSENGPEEKYPAETLRGRNVIILWSQACIAVFVPQGPDLWAKTVITPDSARQKNNATTTLTFAQLENEIVSLAKLPAAEGWQKSFPSENNGIRTSQMFQIVRISIVIFKSLGCFIGGLFLALFVTLFFTIVYRAFSAGNPKSFAFGDLWKISVYAAFPVLLVITAFPALQLPLSGYTHLMFIVGWSLYLFFILRFLVSNPDDAETADPNGGENGNA